jgi:hypothetical protein
VWTLLLAHLFLKWVMSTKVKVTVTLKWAQNGYFVLVKLSHFCFCPPPFRRKKGDIEIGSVRLSAL